MYREQWMQDIMGNRNLLTVALDVHSTQTGAYERSAEVQDNDIKVLVETLRNWKPTTHKEYEYFDNAVHDLIWITLSDLGRCMDLTGLPLRPKSDEYPRETYYE